MKIVLVIDCLTSGGAQRQLLLLATGLRRRGNDVSILTYHPGGLFVGLAAQAKLNVVCLAAKTKLAKVREVRKWLKSHSPDIAYAFLPTPSAVTELAGLGGRTWKLVVSERNNYAQTPGVALKFRFLRQMHHLADWVTTNSHTNLKMMLAQVPNLHAKASVILNAVETERFSARLTAKTQHDHTPFQFVCVASMALSKNALGVLEALRILKQRTDIPFRLAWVGRCDSVDKEQVDNLSAVQARVASSGLQQVFDYAGEEADVPRRLQNSDALVLASFYEGFPNVVCEAMAAALPVVVSAVSDVPSIVKDGVHGFLCDPHSPASIADSLQKCIELPMDTRERMGRAAREQVARLFGYDRFIDEHEKLFEHLLSSR